MRKFIDKFSKAFFALFICLYIFIVMGFTSCGFLRKSIKIATFNISHCQDFSQTTSDYAPENLEKYGEYFQELDMDIIALNEVYISDQPGNSTERLAELGGYSYYVDAVGKVYSWASIGNAILSKYPIETCEVIPVLAPTEEERREGENEWYEDRIILSAVINVYGRRIRVITTHFGLNGLEKERMIEALYPLVDDSDLPVVLMGDFNAEPHTEILAPIYERLKSCADERNTTEYTFSSFNPYTTIDYIFVSNEVEVKEFFVRKEILSDHRACQAKIRI